MCPLSRRTEGTRRSERCLGGTVRLRVEFTTEPFDLDEAPAHAVVARQVIEAAELDEVDVGPFGNTAEGAADGVLAWEGADVVAVRLPQLADSLDHILAAMERKQGKPLADLDRKAKQEVVRILEARGAFSVRHGVETVAGALGVSRFTVYNYLNREKES